MIIIYIKSIFKIRPDKARSMTMVDNRSINQIDVYEVERYKRSTRTHLQRSSENLQRALQNSILKLMDHREEYFNGIKFL